MLDSFSTFSKLLLQSEQRITIYAYLWLPNYCSYSTLISTALHLPTYLSISFSTFPQLLGDIASYYQPSPYAAIYNWIICFTLVLASRFSNDTDFLNSIFQSFLNKGICCRTLQQPFTKPNLRFSLNSRLLLLYFC